MHPTRLGRHGGALVKASFWTREQELEEERANQEAAEAAAAAAAAEEEGSVGGDTMAAGVGASKRRRGGAARSKRQPLVPREHVNLLKGRYREDHRVIDEDCGCPTCRGG